MKTIRFLAVFALLAIVGFAQTSYYVDSRAQFTGNGQINKPFASPLELKIPVGEEAIVHLAKGSTFSLTSGWTIGPNTTVKTYGRGATPILNGGDAAVYGIIRIENASNIHIQDIHLERGAYGIIVVGHAENVTFDNVEVRDIYVGNAFSHETSSSASGQIVYRNCVARRCERDGFNNRGASRDRFYRCDAIECGAIWGRYVLSDRIPAATDDPRTYTLISVTKPTILRTVYLDTVNGADTNTGLSAGDAWATVTKLNASSLAGDRIIIMRGSSWATTNTIVAKSNQEIIAGGEGHLPKANTGGNSGISIDGVTNVWVEGLYFTGCTDGIDINGVVENIWIVDCIFSLNTQYHVQADAGSGDINIYGCNFNFGTRGAVDLAGAFTINAWSCQGNRNGTGYDNADAAAWRIGGTVSGTITNCAENRVHYRGFAVSSTSGTVILDKCWISDPESITAESEQIAIEKSGAGHLEVRNSVITLLDPDAAGKTTIGVHATAGTVTLYNNTFQDERSTGGSGSSCITIESASDLVTWKNNVFDSVNANTTASSYYVTLDADGLNGDFLSSHNWYRGNAASDNLWRDSGGTPADMDVVAFVGVAGIDDDATGEMLDTAFCTVNPAVEGPWAARLTESLTTMYFNALDLSASSDAVTWTKDAGHRVRGRQTTNLTAGEGWTPGAWEGFTGSPDGFTTHVHSDTVRGSTMYLEECRGFDCANGIHFTHTHDTAEGEMGIVRCEFVGCYDGTVETLGCDPFPITDSIFRDGTGPLLDINLEAAWVGLTWEISGCRFENNGGTNYVLIRSKAAMTANVTSCVFIGPVAHFYPQPTVENANIFYLGDGAVTTNFNNNVVCAPALEESYGTRWAIRIDSAADDAMSARNNIFLGPDSARMFWVRAESTSRLGVWDNNFYTESTTNTDRWDVPTDLDYAGWQALTKGIGGANTNSVGWNADPDFLSAPPVAQEYPILPERFKIDPGSAQATGGSDQSAVSRIAFGSDIRPSAGSWPIGPFLGGKTEDVISRVDDRMVFAGLILDANMNENIAIAPSLSLSTTQWHTVSGSLSLSTGTAVPVTIHTGVQGTPGSKVVFTGVIPANGPSLVIEELSGPKGDPLYITFGGSSGTVHGFLKFSRVQ